MITPEAYEEIVEELDGDIRFEGVKCCFLPFFFDDAQSIALQKNIIK